MDPFVFAAVLVAAVCHASWNTLLKTRLDPFATNRAYGFGMEDRRIAGDGVVAGFGEIDGRAVAVYAYDATVFGGSSPTLSTVRAQACPPTVGNGPQVVPRLVNMGV